MTATLAAAPDVTRAGVADLLPGIGARDPAAWAEIVRRYQGFVHARARRYHLQESDILDAVQTTWLRLAEHWDTVDHPDRLGGWLATVVHRECLRILRTRRAVSFDDELAEWVLDPQAGPEQRIVDAEIAVAVRRLVASLHERQRALLDALFHGEPRPYAELSRRMDMPVGSIGPTRARSLNRLRVLIEREGLAPDR
jgi:RNA polymerase sigma factor (sigma-70 family)